MNIPIELLPLLHTIYERAEKIVLVNQHGKSVVCTESRKQAGKIMQLIDGEMRPKHEQAEPGRASQ